MNTKHMIEELQTDVARLEHLLEEYRNSRELPVLARKVRDAITAMSPRNQPTPDVNKMNSDQIYEELTQLVSCTLAFGDFHQDACLRVCQLFTALDKHMRQSEFPRRWTNA